MFRNYSGDFIFCDILDRVECCARARDARGDHDAQFLHNLQWIQIKSSGNSNTKTYVYQSIIPD